jgi:hypothetical protein
MGAPKTWRDKESEGLGFLQDLGGFVVIETPHGSASMSKTPNAPPLPAQWRDRLRRSFLPELPLIPPTTTIIGLLPNICEIAGSYHLASYLTSAATFTELETPVAAAPVAAAAATPGGAERHAENCSPPKAILIS